MIEYMMIKSIKMPLKTIKRLTALNYTVREINAVMVSQDIQFVNLHCNFVNQKYA